MEALFKTTAAEGVNLNSNIAEFLRTVLYVAIIIIMADSVTYTA